jgi:hypothetical protein
MLSRNRLRRSLSADDDLIEEGGKKDIDDENDNNEYNINKKKRRNDLLDPYKLPDKDSPIPWYFFFPQIMSGIIFEKRVSDLIQLNGDEAKMGLLEELSIHILIDSLFFTITAAPILGGTLPRTCSSIPCVMLIMLTYITFNLQLLTIILHAIILFAIVEIPTSVFKDWLVDRQAAIYTVARLHVLGLYIFTCNFVMWPFANYDRSYQIICTACTLSVWATVFYIVGTSVTDGVFDVLNPSIKLIGKPKNEKIRAIAKADIDLFKSLEKTGRISRSISPSASPSKDLETILIELELEHLIEVFRKEHIEIDMILHMDHTDFRNLHISIGERVMIQQKLLREYN